VWARNEPLSGSRPDVVVRRFSGARRITGPHVWGERAPGLRTGSALTSGDVPVDHWLPDGRPPHLPHPDQSHVTLAAAPAPEKRKVGM
ncbi:MAG TPA: hypothetical protein VME44_05915, partial [Streptosporangiaceae bacterium]|nr:hypothetical protein [Streptosporangiaceae bacterium]